MIPNSKFQILVIVGPTSSGKSELAVGLAKKFNGEIISADSRQIYKGMDLGTGKIEGRWKTLKILGRGFSKFYIYKNIVHHLIDFANPRRQYSAALFQAEAKKVIGDILKRGKLPILCGGTGHWIDAVVYNQNIPEVKPNLKLRAQLEKKSLSDLFLRLKKLDPLRASNIDSKNKRRLIRALEIVISTGKPVPPLGGTLSEQSESKGSLNPCPSTLTPFWLGINQPQNILYSKIKKRLGLRLKQGMLKEVKRLHKQGVSWNRLTSFGLEYKFVSLYLQKKLSYDEMFKQLLAAIQHYSKRQLTWWKKNTEIHWIENPAQANALIKNFIQP